MKKKLSDKKLKQLHSQGLNDREIANIVGCNPGYVGVRRRELKIISQKEKERISREEVKRLHSKGLNDRQIAERLGCTRPGIHYIRSRELKLESNYENSELSDEEIKAIYDLNQSGFNDKEIVSVLDICEYTVRKYRKEMGLEPIGKTCCSFVNTVKNPELREEIEMCGKATQEFLARYFRR